MLRHRIVQSASLFVANQIERRSVASQGAVAISQMGSNQVSMAPLTRHSSDLWEGVLGGSVTYRAYAKHTELCN